MMSRMIQLTTQQTRTPNVDDNSPNVASAMLGVTQRCSYNVGLHVFYVNVGLNNPMLMPLLG